MVSDRQSNEYPLWFLENGFTLLADKIAMGLIFALYQDWNDEGMSMAKTASSISAKIKLLLAKENCKEIPIILLNRGRSIIVRNIAKNEQIEISNRLSVKADDNIFFLFAPMIFCIPV